MFEPNITNDGETSGNQLFPVLQVMKSKHTHQYKSSFENGKYHHVEACHLPAVWRLREGNLNYVVPSRVTLQWQKMEELGREKL